MLIRWINIFIRTQRDLLRASTQLGSLEEIEAATQGEGLIIAGE
jgi:hypothetical protein